MTNGINCLYVSFARKIAKQARLINPGTSYIRLVKNLMYQSLSSKVVSFKIKEIIILSPFLCSCDGCTNIVREEKTFMVLCVKIYEAIFCLKVDEVTGNEKAT